MSATIPATLEGSTAFVRDRFLVGDNFALTSITAGTAVKVGAGSSQSVLATAAVTDVLYGVALINANAGQTVTVVTRGLARATASAPLSAGSLVGPSSVAGQVASVPSTTSGTFYNTLPRAICIVGTATSGSTVLIDMF